MDRSSGADAKYFVFKLKRATSPTPSPSDCKSSPQAVNVHREVNTINKPQKFIFCNRKLNKIID